MILDVLADAIYEIEAYQQSRPDAYEAEWLVAPEERQRYSITSVDDVDEDDIDEGTSLVRLS